MRERRDLDQLVRDLWRMVIGLAVLFVTVPILALLAHLLN